jgi:hypothetical protein
MFSLCLDPISEHISHFTLIASGSAWMSIVYFLLSTAAGEIAAPSRRLEIYLFFTVKVWHLLYPKMPTHFTEWRERAFEEYNKGQQSTVTSH